VKIATLDVSAAKVYENTQGKPAFRITNLLGRNGVPDPGPQTFFVESVAADASVRPHYHKVNQFQVFPGGNGRLGAHEIEPVLVHYADAYMTYGPIVAGSEGVQYLTVRAQGDPGPQYMPESRLARKRVNGRHIVHTVAWDDLVPLLEVEAQHRDGLAIFVVNAVAGDPVQLPDVRNAGGLHVFVLDGTLQRAGSALPRLSNIFFEAGEKASLDQAGTEGVRLLLLYFPEPKPDAGADAG
jgi:hypothetical protein